MYQNVERVVREEMDRAGFQEVHFPALLPREPYELSGRWTDYGDNVFRLKDRKGADMLLAPTHEELFTLLVKDLYSSYKDLPLVIYQIQTKFRDEARPRAGLLRGREFVMKDSYSFDLTDEGLEVSYQRHRVAYQRTFDRLGLPYVIVSAMSGAMGGSASEEFLAPMEVGEDTYVRCTNCDYAANTEAVRVAVPPPDPLRRRCRRRWSPTRPTPRPSRPSSICINARDDLRRPDRDWTAADTLKNVVVKLRHPDGRVEPLAVGVPGDREVDMKRLEAQLRPAEIETVRRRRLRREHAPGQGIYRPRRARRRQARGRSLPRRSADRRRHAMGDRRRSTRPPCPLPHRRPRLRCRRHGRGRRGGRRRRMPRCGSALEIARGIEIGHIFQLGRKFAKALGLNVLDQNGKQQVVTMGSYGIGVSRAVAAIAEMNNDEKGLIWPHEVAPADVHIVATGKAGDPQFPRPNAWRSTARPPACACCSTIASEYRRASSSTTQN